MTAEALSAALNVSETTLHYWETSELELPDVITKKIVGVLDVSIAYLLGDSDNPDHKPLPPKGAAPELLFPDRRKNRLWLREMPHGGSAPNEAVSCIKICRELQSTLQNEGARMTQNELAALLHELENLRSLTEDMMKGKASRQAQDQNGGALPPKSPNADGV